LPVFLSFFGDLFLASLAFKKVFFHFKSIFPLFFFSISTFCFEMLSSPLLKFENLIAVNAMIATHIITQSLFTLSKMSSRVRSTHSFDSLGSIDPADFLDCPPSPCEELPISEFRLKEMNGELAPEPLLIEDKSRFVLFPIRHNDVSTLHF